MKYDPDRHHRRSIRLPGHDYAGNGLYFVTLCTHERQYLFGEIIDGAMQLNAHGQIVADEWLKSASIRAEITLDAWVVMPNHFHGIVLITPTHQTDPNSPIDNVNPLGTDGRTPTPQPLPDVIHRSPKSLSSLMAGFKSAVTRQINLLRDTPDNPVWQRNYHEHLIRNPETLVKIQEYVANNSLNWSSDSLHPANFEIPNPQSRQ
jgi:putative transposase